MDEQALPTAPLTRTPLFKHQQTAFDLSKDRQYFGLLMEQGTGKTLVILATAEHLRRSKKIDGVLVLCADGLHYNWRREIALHAAFEEPTVALWDASMGKKAWNSWTYAASMDGGFPVLLANIEAVRTERFRDTLDAFVTKRRVLLVLDESTCIANPKAKQTKEAVKLGVSSCYTRILSGTPIRQNITDLWSQCNFLSPSALPYPSYVSFCAEFTEKIIRTVGSRTFSQITGYKNQDVLTKLIGSFTFRCLKSEALDLPPKIYSTLHSPMTEEQMAQYRTLRDGCLLALDTLEDGVMLVPQILPRIIKLQQVASGFVYDDKGNCHQLSTSRISTLTSLLERCGYAPSIVFCAFREDVVRVCTALREKGMRVCEYHGDTPSHQREDAVVGFQEGRYDFFVATRAASKGLTLHRAEYVIFYSQGWSLEARLQSEDRAHRIGLTHSVNYVTICAPGTIDEKIAGALLRKHDLASAFLDKAAIRQFLTDQDDVDLF